MLRSINLVSDCLHYILAFKPWTSPKGGDGTNRQTDIATYRQNLPMGQFSKNIYKQIKKKTIKKI